MTYVSSLPMKEPKTPFFHSRCLFLTTHLKMRTAPSTQVWTPARFWHVKAHSLFTSSYPIKLTLLPVVEGSVQILIRSISTLVRVSALYWRDGISSCFNQRIATIRPGKQESSPILHCTICSSPSACFALLSCSDLTEQTGAKIRTMHVLHFIAEEKSRI